MLHIYFIILQPLESFLWFLSSFSVVFFYFSIISFYWALASLPTKPGLKTFSLSQFLLLTDYTVVHNVHSFNSC